MGYDPAFLFYPGDFLIGTAELTNEEVGQYIRALSYMHQKGRLNEKTIRLLLGSISDTLKSKFCIDDNGLWYNNRLENEIEKRRNFYQSRLDNGRKGGRPKTINKPNGNLNKTESKPNSNLPVNKDRDRNKDESGNESGIADKKDNEKSLEYLDNNLNSFKIEEFSLIDVDNEYKKFRDYLKANGKRYKDYMAAFRNWLRSDYVKKNKVVKYGLD